MSDVRSVDEYIDTLDPKRRETFCQLRDWIRGTLPEAKETMVYGMPTYEMGRPICAIAAQKRYFCIYLCEAEALNQHRRAFAGLNLGKSCIRFRRISQLPIEDVERVLLEAAEALQKT